MPTPAKPFVVLKSENKSHRTKKELKQREEGEKALATGVAIRERPEVKNNPTAHKEFLRLKKLLKGIDKFDAIYEPIINRYCLIQAECKDLELKRERIYEQAQNFEEMLEEQRSQIGFEEYRAVVKDIAKLYGTMIALDKQIQTKRKMLLDIEKENVMTIAAALRSIPKKVEKSSSKLLEALNGS